MLAIFNGKATFDTPKPRRLLEFVLTVAGNQNTLILDSFAGSGTTAHAVLNMNKADGGNRKFILAEMMDYADSITAERVKRVIQGYGEGKNAVEGTGGSFSFYDLGQPLLIGENLNEEVAPEKIREYIWFMETKAPYAPPAGENAYYLGSHNHTAYYFYYEPPAHYGAGLCFSCHTHPKGRWYGDLRRPLRHRGRKAGPDGHCVQENTSRHYQTVRRVTAWN